MASQLPRTTATVRFAVGGLLMSTLAMVTACDDPPTSPSAMNCVAASGSGPLTLQAGDVFRVRFNIPSGQTGDVLFSILGLPNGPTTWRASFRLYNGGTLLGVQDDLHDSVAFWKSRDSLFGGPGSPYSISGPAVAVDFSAILNGTIDGRLEFAVTSGPMSLSETDQSTIERWQPNPNGSSLGIRAVIAAREVCR